MTSIGDTAGYSTSWFAPKKTFTNERVVSWDVNVTDLKKRQWWEMTIVPANFNSGVPSCPQCSAESYLPSGLPNYPADSIVVGNGPFGGAFHVIANGDDIGPGKWRGICGEFSLDPEGCASKAIRRTFTIRDNGNNTLTLSALGKDYTFAGKFPTGGFNVVFKDQQLHTRQGRTTRRPYLALGQHHHPIDGR